MIIWRSKDEIFFCRNRAAIRQGDVLIVPSSYGGADEFGWIGTSAHTVPVIDLAEEAAWKAGRAPFIRLHPEVLAQNRVQAPKSFFGSVQSEESEQTWKDWLAVLTTRRSDIDGKSDWDDLNGFF
ncbi:MAG: hypothetical protein WDN28_02110 [Chthoniobacter sp.]